MDINNVLFDFDDLLIAPAVLTPIRSRKEVTVRYENGFLPLMTAPMDTVIGTQNYKLFRDAGIVPVLPRAPIGEYIPDVSFGEEFFSYGLDQFEKIFLSGDKIIIDKNHQIRALIDVANGHMEALYEITKKAKKLYGDEMILMIGNIANPDTYEKYCSTNVDYIRLGIGNGNSCLTSVQTGIGYPLAPLIKECYKLKKRYGCPKIVADGGFKKYADVIKGLALGCFLPQTLVFGKDGMKKIKNLKIGDYVYTHNNRLKKILNKFEYDNNKDIIEINGILSTNNHRYYVVDKKFNKIINDENIHQYAKWVSAENLTNDYLLVEKTLKLRHRGIIFLEKIYNYIFIRYKIIKGEIHEKKTSKPICRKKSVS